MISKQISFLVWRDSDGKMGVFPPTCIKRYSAKSTALPAILAQVRTAAGLFPPLQRQLTYMVFYSDGSLCNTEDNRFNEIAPRPHNSFHWTIEGCVTSQFRQLVVFPLG